MRAHPLVVLLAAVHGVGQAPATAAPATDPALLALLWTQHAAEHRALCRQAFNAARPLLEVALTTPDWSAALEQAGQPGMGDLPPAVVVDVDETVLDNSPFNARCVLRGQPFTAPAWSQWTQEAQAGALAGAVEFLTFAARKGVTVFYVTNRSHGDEPPTRANLQQLGFPLRDDGDVDVVLCRGEHDEEGDKGPRRARIAKTHRVLMVFGDDLNDFMSAVRPRQSARHTPASRQREGEALAAERRQRTDDFADFWGTRWFMLPNPVYGSWLETVKAQAASEDGPALPTQLATKEVTLQGVERNGAK